MRHDMEHPFHKDLLVALEVDAKIGNNWYECKWFISAIILLYAARTIPRLNEGMGAIPSRLWKGQTYQAPFRQQRSSCLEKYRADRDGERDAVQSSFAEFSRLEGARKDYLARRDEPSEQAHQASSIFSSIQQHNYKYAPDYDIINLSRSEVLPPELRPSPVLDPRKKEYHDPSYQDYNIINGKGYQPDYLKQVGFKRVNPHPRNLKPEQPRSYNIVNGSYEDHTRREEEPSPHPFSKSQLLRVQDSINGRYANPEQEKEEYKEYKSVPRKLPPSYLNR